MRAGTLEIEIVAEIAKLQQDMKKVEKTVGDMSTNVGRSTKAANDNLRGVGRGAGAGIQEFSREVARLKASIDPAFASMQKYKGEVRLLQQALREGAITHKQYVDQMRVAVAGYQNAGQVVTRSTNAQRAGMQQLSFQLNDVATMYAMGARPAQIFASQIGQVTQAIGLMSNSSKGLIGFLGGPWGMALTSAVILISAFASGHDDASDASKTHKDAADDLKKAVEELTAAQQKDILATADSIRVTIARAEADRDASREARQRAIAEYELLKAQMEQANLAARLAGRGDGSTGARAGSAALSALRDFQAGDVQNEIIRLNTEIAKSMNAINQGNRQLVDLEIEAKYDAMRGASDRYDTALAKLRNEQARGIISMGEYRKAADALRASFEVEQEAIRKSSRAHRERKSEAQKAYERQLAETQRFIESLDLEIAKLGLDEKALRQLEIQRASDAAATKEQRDEIARLNKLREDALALQAVEQARKDNAGYQRNVIAPIEREMQVLGLLGAEREKAISRLEEQAEVEAALVEIMAAEAAGNAALAEELRKRIDMIRQKFAMERQGIDAIDRQDRETEALRRFNDQLLEMISLMQRMGGLGSTLGGLLGLFSGQTGSIGGPIGDLLNITTSGTRKDASGREIARNLGDELRDIFKLSGEFGKTMTSLLGGAGTGMIAGQAIFGRQSQTEQLGSAVGGALGKVAGEAVGKAIGGIAGKLGGPLGSIVGGVLGGVLGGMLSKTPWGRVTLSSQGASNPEGNSGASRRAAVKAGGSFDTALQGIADAFGGGIGDFGNITLGVRHGDWRVNSTGTSLKKKKGATDFDGDAEGAIAFAIQIAIERGAITGIRESTQRLLKSSDDLKRNLDRALSFEGVFKELASIKDPIGFAMDELTREFDRLRDIFDEAGASAAEYAQLEELLAHKRQEVSDKAAKEALDKLGDRNALEVELLRLLGKEEDALAATRLNELANLEASLRPLQAMVYQLQDARAVMDQFGPLADDLKAFRAEIMGGGATNNSMAFIERQFRETAALARNGDAAALGQLRGTATEFLDAAKANASSALEYQRAVGEVLASVDDGIFAADSQIEYAQLQIDAINNSANILQSMKDEMAVYQQRLVEQGEWVERQFRRWDSEGLRIQNDSTTPIYTEAA